MSGPRFTILAHIDDTRFISACAHGVAHLTWERLTLRLRLDELEAVARLMAAHPAGEDRSARAESGLLLAFRPGPPAELHVGTVVLRLSPAEVRQLGGALQQACRRLDEIRAGGEWDTSEPSPPPDRPVPFGPIPFSKN